jgi:O-antigen/teichoic acid export membrane protein
MDDAARARLVAPSATTTGTSSPSDPTQRRSYARGARVLSIGIAATGVLTFAYFSIASHVLTAVAAKRIDLLWSVMFVIISVIYRPIEQLLSRTIASRRAVGAERQPLRVPLTIQAGFALVFLATALALRTTITNDVFDHYSTLYWVLVAGTLAYAASYFARGWLAGHEHFGLYGGLVLLESLSRVAFALAVAVGIAHGQSAVALGIAAAPLVSLVVVPWAFARRSRTRAQPPPDATQLTVADADAAVQGPAAEGVEEATRDLSLRHGTGFAFSVSGIMLAEQTLLNAAVLTVDATSANHALAGIVFNVLLIARAPLQLFQSIQTTLLPHLAGLEATAGKVAFARAVRVTLIAIAAFALVVAVALLAIGPFAMRHLFGQHFGYGRAGLAIVGLGMGLHLSAGALNQAALARGQAAAAAATWLAAGALFVGWLFVPAVGNQLLRVELGYFGATGLLTLALYGLYRRGR